MNSLSREEVALEALRYLSSQVAARPLVHDLVERDVQRWPNMNPDQRQSSLERNIWRVGAVAPWTRSKGRVMAALEALKGAPPLDFASDDTD